jgi:MoaA/NifB/PqqE/SkfB family radical SAM enzyme
LSLFFKTMSPIYSTTPETHRITSLPILVLHAHSSCNCRCIMCDIWKTKESNSFSLARLRPLLHSIRELQVRWIVFTGGEPLMNPELPALCALLRAEEIHLTVLTTGLLLLRHAQQVVDSFDDIIVSLDGPPAIHDQVRQVQRAFHTMQTGITAIRQKRPDMRITARTTVQKANHRNLRETVSTAKALGLDGISFLAADLTSEAFNRATPWTDNRQAQIGLSFDEVHALAAEVEALVVEFRAEIEAGYISESAEKLRRMVHHFRAHLGLEQPRSPICNAPWVSAVVETDGTVRPCFFHRPIGTLQTNDLVQVLNSEQALAFRAGLDVAANPVCNRCVCSLHYRDPVPSSECDLSHGSSTYAVGSPKLPAGGR